MDRRDFLTVAPGSLLLSAFGCASQRDSRPRDVFAQLVGNNDARMPKRLASQERRRGHPSYGGVADRYGLYHAGAAGGLVRDCVAAFACPESRYFSSGELVAPMLDAARFLRGVQHADGTIDLMTTNFHSPPDTAFVLESILPSIAVLRRARSAETSDVLAELESFARSAADALAVGGIHTPNHRWVACRALARAHGLFAQKRYVERVDQWLAESIDIDADGQFTERSTSVYSPLTDHCFMTVARLLDRPELLQPARKNLEMTMFYVHADGEVVTESSRRQDQYRPGSLIRYYVPYRWMAQHDRDGRFAAMARWIEELLMPRLTARLIEFVETPSLREPMPPSAPLPDDYERHFSHSDLVRIRRGSRSATILAQNPVFFSYHDGSAALAVRFATAFFGKGQFVGEKLRREGDAWVLEQSLRGPYYQPLADEHRIASGEWAKMPRALRAQSEVQELRAKVAIRENAGRFELQIDVAGTDRVPIAIELAFRGGGTLDGVTRVEPGVYLASKAEGRYRFGDDEIRFSPGCAEHRWTQLRGALPKVPGDSVYLTGKTPFRWRLVLS